jgi:Ca-activated chloride channel family protein
VSDKPAAKNGLPQEAAKPAATPPAAGPGRAALGSESEALAPLIDIQEQTHRRTQLLKLKAEAELTRPEPPAAQQNKQSPSSGQKVAQAPAAAPPNPVDPQQLKAAYQKAIELAPRAAEQMERVTKSLKQTNTQAAYPPAEQARKILEEIQKAQPKQDQKDQKQQDQDKKNEDQQKKDQQKKDQQKKDEQNKDEQNKDEQNKDQQKKDQQNQDNSQKKDQQQKDQEKKNQDESGKSGEQKQEQPQVSRDRIEEALRKVRERQQEKRERDRAMKARVFGRAPVEKDW